MPTKTQRVMDDLTARIRSGEYPPGVRLPSRRELAVAYGVSEQTIRNATYRLAVAGLLESVPRGGYYVRRR
ncbi:winged helix-turn-helix domain-containing protein [Micromonospora sp. HM5-17]|uniref:winged helix-turn-helix domain-containing protein n=1 Tax=Micromonospora sp. HM5-17 TaxID=2487710 RepID=UPI001F32FADB|nr:winged helix-turn-helix domain-containing protein [Micromonospora sp. HM5-17]